MNVRFEVVLCGEGGSLFPEDSDTVEEVVGRPAALIVSPFLPSQGRIVIDDIAYKTKGDDLVPHELEATGSSDLQEWLQQRLGNRLKPDSVVSISLRLLRSGSPQRVAGAMDSLPRGCVVIVNALVRQDMDVFAAGLLLSQQKSGQNYLFYSAAGLVASRLGIDPMLPLRSERLFDDPQTSSQGGVVILGDGCPSGHLLNELSRRDPTLMSCAITETAIQTSPMKANLSKSGLKDPIGSGRDVLLSLGGSCAVADLSSYFGRTRPRYIVVIVGPPPAADDLPELNHTGQGSGSFSMATGALGVGRVQLVGEAFVGAPIFKVADAKR